MNNKLLTGLEAIELMKEGKMITNGHLVYKYEDGIVKCVSIMFLESNQANWCDHSVLCLNSDAYEEYIEPKPLTGWERLKNGEGYYKLANSTSVTTDVEECHSIDNKCYDNANYFSTEEKAEEINFKQTLFRKLQRFSDENGGDEIDWNDGDQLKYFISFNYNSNAFYIDFQHRLRDFGNVYFISRKVAEQAVDLFHDDLIKYFMM